MVIDLHVLLGDRSISRLKCLSTGSYIVTKKSYAAAINAKMRLVPHWLIHGVLDNAFCGWAIFWEKRSQIPSQLNSIAYLDNDIPKTITLQNSIQKVCQIDRASKTQTVEDFIVRVWCATYCPFALINLVTTRTGRSCAIMVGQVCYYSGFPIWVHVVVVVRLTLNRMVAVSHEDVMPMYCQIDHNHCITKSELNFVECKLLSIKTPWMKG